jgi:hypothetical protein
MVDRKGKILFAHYAADYTVHLGADKILAAAP